MAQRLVGNWDFILLLILLGAVIPWRGARRMSELLARPQLSTAERVETYISTILLQWCLTALVAWRCFAHGLGLRELGLILGNGPLVAAVAATMSALFGTVQWLAARQASKSPDITRSRGVAIAIRLMPQALADSLVFVALVATAGLCEEFLYRGFVYAVLSRTLSDPAAVLGSSLLFCLAHLYQGQTGLVSTFILGVLLALSRWWTGSLVPAMAAHMVVDLAAGFVAARYLRRAASARAAAPVSGILIID